MVEEEDPEKGAGGKREVLLPIALSLAVSLSFLSLYPVSPLGAKATL